MQEFNLTVRYGPFKSGEVLGKGQARLTTEQKILKTKVGVLKWGKPLGNAEKACQMMGYSRESFYCFKKLYETGVEGALEAQVAQEGCVLGVDLQKSDKEAYGEFESECPAYCGTQDTFYFGTLKWCGPRLSTDLH